MNDAMVSMLPLSRKQNSPFRSQVIAHKIMGQLRNADKNSSICENKRYAAKFSVHLERGGGINYASGMDDSLMSTNGFSFLCVEEVMR